MNPTSFENVASTRGFLGLSPNEVRQFSFVDAIADVIQNKKPTGFYREITDAVASRVSTPFEGFAIPYDLFLPSRSAQRDLSVTDATKGGYAAANEQGELIEMLRNSSVARKLGVQFLTGIQGNLDLPRQITGSTAYWLTEDGSGATSDGTFDTVKFSPKRLFASTVLSKQLFVQMAGGAERYVRGELMATVGTEQDRVIFQGTGSNGQPRGILNTPGIKTITFAGAATYPKYINARRLSNAANVKLDNSGFILTPAAVEKGLTIPRFASTAGTIISDLMTIANAAVEETNQMPGDRMLYGANWSDAVVVEFGAMDVVVDPVTMFAAGRVKITTQLLCDVNVRHPEAYCASTDSAAQ